MAIAPGTRMTYQDFLAMPERTEAPYLEFEHGKVVPKSMPNRNHGRLVVRLGTRLDTYLEQSGEAHVETEVRHANDAEERILLPDVSVTLNERVSRSNPVTEMPDFAIEVLSPDDRPGRVNDRVDFYLRNGVRLAWIVDPESRTVAVHQQDAPMRVAHEHEILDAAPVLAGFELVLADLFAVLPAESEDDG